MSEYNIQMNKYNALNAEYDQLYPQPMKHANTHAKDGSDPITPSMIGTYNKTEIDTALQKKAPAGYGLGKNSGMSITDGDEAVYGGNYYWGNTTQNLPFSYGFMGITVRADGSLIQTAYSEAYPGCSAQRKCTDGTFGEWEWVNPPMILGVEYRTTERYQGKPVYVKIVDFGALPANSKKVVAHGIDNLGYVLDYSGSAGYWVVSSIPWISNIEFTNTNIEITTNADEGAYVARIILKYFKETD